MYECFAVDRRHLCHHRSIRQIGSTFDLYTCIAHLISCFFVIYCSRFLISFLVVFASGLMNKCPLKGHLVLQSIPGSVASCVVGRSVLFPDMPADIWIWAKTTARGGLMAIFPSIRSIRKPIMKIITSPAQCGYVLATGCVDSSTLIHSPFLELYLLQSPIEDIKEKS